MRILVTGSNGFLGKHLCHSLLNYNLEVIGVDYKQNNTNHGLYSKVTLDLTDKEKVFHTVSDYKPDYLIHLASLKNRISLNADFFTSYQTNVSISTNVIEACLELENFKRFVFLGSCDEYGNIPLPFNETQQEQPSNSYGLSKLAITKLLISLSKFHNFPAVVLRPTVIYGPEQGNEMFLPALIQSLLSKKDFAMTQGEQLRDLIYIDDVISAIINSINADDEANGNVINIGAGISHRIKDIALVVSNLIGSGTIKNLKLGELPYRKNEVMNYAANINLAQEKIHWKPEVQLEDGLRKTIEHYQSQINKN